MDNNKTLTLKYNRAVPRYTSYPTAPHFSEKVGAADAGNWLAKIDVNEPISLYLHIPFCHQMCWYCGCNTRVVNNYSEAATYVQTLAREIEMVSKKLGHKQLVSHLAWGGGTPTYLQSPDFAMLSDLLSEKFEFTATAERAVEIDPRTFADEIITTLAEAGINRASFGVQDFEDDVQQAINRIQPFAQVKDVTERLRAAGITDLNFDLMYGLPKQNVATIKDTVAKAASLQPQRLALFGYAHVPWMKKHQQMLEKYHIPDESERYDLYHAAVEALAKEGYIAVGIDHFALPSDPLAKAAKAGTLHRNFQGYTNDSARTLIGFGASSISDLPNGYLQNHTSTKAYSAAINSGELATAKGIAVTAEDKIRREIINQLMCNFSATNINEAILAAAMPALQPLIDDNLAKASGGTLTIPNRNHAVVRLAASCFDNYFQQQAKRHAQAV